MKTLAVILHHNTPQYTDTIYRLLNSDYDKLGGYDLVVIDNGSDVNKGSQFATYKLDMNVYFGGGLNAAMELVLESKDYDSLLFLNSDLIVGGNFVRSLRTELTTFDVVSPCIIQPELTQNHWRQMLPWGQPKTRSVEWIDLQAPLISRRFIELLASQTKEGDSMIPQSLIRGWGIDVWFGILCKQQGWKTGVCDYVPAIHLGSMTLKALGNTNEYCRLAEQGMAEFVHKNNLESQFSEMRLHSQEYFI